MTIQPRLFAAVLGRAALDVWGDMPRDIQEALFEDGDEGTGSGPRGIRTSSAQPSPSQLCTRRSLAEELQFMHRAS